MVKNPYVCPRCDFQSEKKSGISRHFKRKTLCSDNNNLELTPEIIDVVLAHHRYHPPQKEASNTVNKVINNYNTMNNFITQMDLCDKMDHLLSYQQKTILDLEDGLETRFETRVTKLENDQYRAGYFLSFDDLINLINDVTKVNKGEIEKLNVIFDKTIKRFKLYRCQEWDSFLEDMGAKELVSLTKSYFFDTYEIYLIRNSHIDNCRINRFKLQEHIEIYYHFIAIFDLLPHVQDYDDYEIVGHRLVEDNNSYLAEKYLNVYCQQKKQLKVSEKNRVKRKIINIVKENTTHGIMELNKTILEILKVDENFKQELLKSHQLADKECDLGV